ncbi:MAG: diaminopimelate epimerase [Candidatus Aegiribacteria sp.]
MLKFVKMSGAGNDFILIDNLDGTTDTPVTAELVRALCRRGLSVGADGVLEMGSDPEFPFRMRYYNSDGGEAEMCGNGGRCIAAFAARRGLVEPGEDFSFRSAAGVHRARVTGPDSARIWMTDPAIHFLDRKTRVGSHELSLSFVNTGVPHAVAVTGGPDIPPFDETARRLRSHSMFGQAGANVNYLWTDNGSISMRTWERGVEGETLACGTGAVACAICAVELLGCAQPVDIGVRSGLTLTAGNDEKGWWLQGEARAVYSGVLESLPGRNLTEGP